MQPSNAVPELLSVQILGLRLDAITVDAAIDRIVEHAADPTSLPVCVVQTDVALFFRNRGDADRKIVNRAWLSLANGVGVQWAAAYLENPSPSLPNLLRSLRRVVSHPESVTKPLPERVAGDTFSWRLLLRCRDQELRVAVIGSPKHQSVKDASIHLRREIPGIDISDAISGRGAEVEPNALAVRLQASKPDIVLVAIGHPLQERLSANLAELLDHGVLIGEGGTLDYEEFGGAIPRAPEGMRRAGLEWLWRLRQEPTRLRRQLAIPWFIWRVHRSAKWRSLDRSAR